MKVWITKYALTKGIIEVEAHFCIESSKMIEVRQGEYYHGREWHETRSLAVSRAIEMRDAALVTARAKVKQLEQLTFE
jgi:hypothetical protein